MGMSDRRRLCISPVVRCFHVTAGRFYNCGLVNLESEPSVQAKEGSFSGLLKLKHAASSRDTFSTTLCMLDHKALDVDFGKL